MQIYAAIFGILIALLCFFVLFRTSRKNRQFLKTLIILSFIVFFVNTIADGIIMWRITEGEHSPFSLAVLACFHSLELFVFQTHFFDNGYQEFFFGTADGDPSHPWFAFLFAITFILACFVSVSLVIRAFNRRRAGRVWLADHKNQSGNSHLFFLGGGVPRIVAKSIKATHPDHTCIFIGYPDPEDSYMGLSIWEKIQRLFDDSDNYPEDSFDAVVYSRVPLNKTGGTDICKKMNLNDLDFYLRNGSCKVYLLSDDDKENLRCVEILHQYFEQCQKKDPACQSAEIFCRSCREGINRRYESALASAKEKNSSINIHLVNTAGLAVHTIKGHPELLPVQYVHKGVNAAGQPEGWVDSPFRAMILGFGETGQEMLGFLYEYGAFVDKDFRKSPFQCTVLDAQMDLLELSFKNKHRGMNEDVGISYKQCAVWSNAFWELLKVELPSLNYIAICLGDDRVNLRIAFELVEFAYQSGKDLSRDFAILVNQEIPTHLDGTTLEHYRSIEPYHDCIKTFGSLEEIWTYDHITGESLRNRAKQYFDKYNLAFGEEGDWDKRNREILTTKVFERHAQMLRQRSQDYANCLHATTKLALTDPALLDSRKEIAQDIPGRYSEAHTHYTGTNPHIESMLHYLAVGEHLRWEASHIAMGYVYGDKTDDIKKTQKNLRPFEELDPKTRHYDYLVIKTTYELY